jgi:AMP-binding enzyme C-terminal domain
MPSSPTLSRRAPRQQGGTGSPKHPLSVNPGHGQRNHPPNRTSPRFSCPHTGAESPERSERQLSDNRRCCTQLARGERNRVRYYATTHLFDYGSATVAEFVDARTYQGCDVVGVHRNPHRTHLRAKVAELSLRGGQLQYCPDLPGRPLARGDAFRRAPATGAGCRRSRCARVCGPSAHRRVAFETARSTKSPLASGHREVFDALVVAVPDPRYGQHVAAVVRPRGGTRPTLAELEGFVRSDIAGYEVPHSLSIRGRREALTRRQFRLPLGQAADRGATRRQRQACPTARRQRRGHRRGEGA